ncbi:MAG TPA: T9SS type A sorting domain-containing protein [Candidatus Cloacimonadota bacterium]|nr:T9SS type A sorting domain-containing protein [Candidatus Cloacimonadota bacterium]
MINANSAVVRLRFALLLILIIGIGASALQAQVLFSFNVNDLEAYDRSGNWIYDADGPTGPPYPLQDQDWFSLNPVPAYPFHYYAERYIHEGVPTTLTCLAENVAQADNPGQLTMSFTQFNLVSFKRINTVNPLAPWNIPGQSGDQRVYANAGGTISYNGTPVLTMTDATFVITTPYPNQAQIQALNPIFATWTGDIGTGAPQTGFGYGDLDLAHSDPAWIPLFAASNYKIELQMAGITSVVTPTAGYFDFTLNVLPATTSYIGGNVVVDLGNLPELHPIPGTDATLEANAGTPGGQNGDLRTLFLAEIGVPPSGNIPAGFNYSTKKHWELGGTLQTFNVDVSLNLGLDDFQAKAPSDWRIVYRSNAAQDWALWPDQLLSGPTTITAQNVTDFAYFAVVSPFDETLPVVLSSFAAYVNSNSLAELKWTTASETDMTGFKVYSNSHSQLGSAICLTPVVIPASNTSDGAHYSYTATELEGPGTFFFWLEALSMNGQSDFYGPVSVNLPADPGTPVLPPRSELGIAYPNPFRSGSMTRIAVDIKEGETGTLEIYNIAGQKIKSQTMAAGSHNIDWDGKDASGRQVASGVYYYKLSTGSYTQSRKLVIVK